MTKSGQIVSAGEINQIIRDLYLKGKKLYQIERQLGIEIEHSGMSSDEVERRILKGDIPFRQKYLQEFIPKRVLHATKGYDNSSKRILPKIKEVPIIAGVIERKDMVKKRVIDRITGNKKMTEEKLKELKYNYGRSHSDIDALLEEANEYMGGYGVEPVQPEGAWVDHYYQTTIALYVNMGDTYEPTLVYDTENGEYILTSWGIFYEGWELEHPELSENDE